MIVKLVGVPSLSAMNFQLIAEQLGFTYVQVSVADKKLRLVKNKSSTFFCPIYVAFCTSAEAYNQVSKRIAKARSPYLVLVSDNPLLFAEHGVYLLNTFELTPKVYATVKITPGDILSCINAAHRLHEQSIPFDSSFCLRPKHETAYGILTSIIEASALHLVQPLFYVIKDHGLRREVQNSVFLYIAGYQNKIGKAGEFSRIVEELASDQIQKLRAACIYALTHSVAEAGARYRVDTFEVNYVLSRSSTVLKEAQP